VIISELMADNNVTLRTRTRVNVVAPFEGPEEAPDWIELLNVSGQRLDLGGLHLTDDAADRAKWEFPEGTSLEAGGHLVVFASGDDIRNPALDERGFLHTNFSLESGGEYLALTDRDGAVIHEFAPAFPAQRVDVSYRVPMQIRALVDEGAAMEYLVPEDDSLQASWPLPGFADPRLVTADANAGSPIGFDRGDSPAEQGATLGGELIDRPSVDFSRGSIVVLESMPFTTSGQVEQWSVFSKATRVLTPLILRASGDEFEIVGIGRERTSDGSGAQTFPFELESGSDFVDSSGYYFGLKDGNNVTDESGTVVWGRSNVDTVRRYNGPQSGNVVVGKQLTGGQPFGRTFSLQATTRVRLAGPLRTDVATAMSDATSVYVRYPFTVARPESLKTLSLHIRYEDGFVALLNGVEIARRNVPVGASYDATALQNQTLHAANQFEVINVSQFLDVLVEGENVLAVHGFNDTATAAEFLIDARLSGADMESVEPLGFAADPTPGRENGFAYEGFVATPSFSHSRGFYQQPLQVELATPGTPEAVIYFTRDGSLPTPGNPQAQRYEQPIDVSGTTILRAAGYLDGRLPSLPQTHSYVFPADVVTQGTLNATVTTNPVWGPQLIDSLQALPTISIVTPSNISEVEVPTSVELIHPDGTTGFQVDAGLEIYGGTAVSFPKRSMRLSFKKSYGPATLDFDVFDDPAGVTEFDQLLLRAGSHDTSFWTGAAGAGSYVRNRWASDRQLEMGHPAPRGRFVQLYINGVYWGQYHLMERPNAAFMASHFGGDKLDYDALNAGRPVDGDLEAWNQLLESLDDGYEAVKSYLDVVNYADYILLQWFGGNNVDWRFESNWMAARRRQPNAGFQFFAWDSDVVLRTPLTTDIVNYGGPGFLWIRDGGVQQYPEFLQLLAERAQLHFFDGGMFTPAALRRQLDELADQMRVSVIAETARWGSGLYTPDSWEQSIQWMKDTFASETGPSRAEVVIEQMRQAGYFPLADTPELALDGVPVTDDTLTVGAELTLTAADGEIYYTLDGRDPRELAPTVDYTQWVAGSAPVRALVPQDNSLGSAWYQPEFDDSGWIVGTSGVGYDTVGELAPLIQLDLRESMHNVNATAYLRVPFQVDDPAQFDTLEFGIRYDDGFVAYLNGVEVARRFAPQPAIWNSRATAAHANIEAVELERFNLSRFLHLLKPGENLLAIQGLNTEPGNVDFLMAPELRAGKVRDMGIAADALRYTGPITVPEGATLKARTIWKGEWSTLRSAAVPTDPFPLRVTEVMYHPADPTPEELAAGFTDADDFEFIEFVNMSNQPLDLSAVSLVQTNLGGQTEGVVFAFADGDIPQLAAGQHVLVVENRSAFEARYGTQLPVAGQWSGGLSNSREQLTVMVEDQVLQQFSYRDDWHPATDGAGASLEIIDATNSDLASWTRGESWRASAVPGGTPGSSGAVRVAGDVNQDGVFDSDDLLIALQAGKYEDGIAGNSTFEEGDWDGDGDFTTADLVYVFQQGHFADRSVPFAAPSIDWDIAAAIHSADARDRYFQQLAEDLADDDLLESTL
jgi:hypothetical protein